MRTKLLNAIRVSALALLFSFGLSFVYAWTAPISNPPAGNVSAPINTSATLQQKSGDFTVQNFLANTMTVGGTINANAITAPQFCIGASCITAWTQAGQPKVTGSCAVGQAITAIAADGTVTCGTTGGFASAVTTILEKTTSGSCGIPAASLSCPAAAAVTSCLSSMYDSSLSGKTCSAPFVLYACGLTRTRTITATCVQ